MHLCYCPVYSVSLCISVFHLRTLNTFTKHQVNRVLQLLESPYSPPGDTAGADEKTESACAPTPDNYESASMSAYFSKPPEWSLGLCVT